MVDTPIVSEGLQQQFRQTFPSQLNSGRDLHVSDVIIPIVDFTGEATTSLPSNLNNAIDFSMTDTGLVHDQTVTVVNTTGFYRIQGVCVSKELSTQSSSHFTLDDGSTTKVVFSVGMSADTNDSHSSTETFDFVVFLSANLTLKLVCPAYGWARAHSRQIADITGVATVPLNYTT